MKNTIFSVLLWMVLVGLLIFPACKESDNVNVNLLLGTTWRLQSIQLIESNVIQVTDTYTLLFKDDNTVSMTIDCNTCFGTYASSPGGSLGFSSPTCTEVFCGVDSVENTFRAALSYAYGYEFIGNTMRVAFTNSATNAAAYLTFLKEK